MRRLFAPAAFAAVALAIMPTLSFAEPAEEDVGGIPVYPSTAPINDTTFDLGIDVTGVEHNPTAVRAFILGLAPVTQGAIVGACEHFMANPESIQSPETYAFCENAVRG